MLLERFPEVQSLDPKDKWRLIDELWCDLALQVEGEATGKAISFPDKICCLRKGRDIFSQPVL